MREEGLGEVFKGFQELAIQKEKSERKRKKERERETERQRQRGKINKSSSDREHWGVSRPHERHSLRCTQLLTLYLPCSLGSPSPHACSLLAHRDHLTERVMRPYHSGWTDHANFPIKKIHSEREGKRTLSIKAMNPTTKSLSTPCRARTD